MLNFTQLTWH